MIKTFGLLGVILSYIVYHGVKVTVSSYYSNKQLGKIKDMPLFFGIALISVILTLLINKNVASFAPIFLLSQFILFLVVLLNLKKIIKAVKYLIFKI
jgi:hypothetical protein|tara:strand:- start:979 stop:1269 length:291 start_codon:yes stop_codon:yes gene_type:complete